MRSFGPGTVTMPGVYYRLCLAFGFMAVVTFRSTAAVSTVAGFSSGFGSGFCAGISPDGSANPRRTQSIPRSSETETICPIDKPHIGSSIFTNIDHPTQSVMAVGGVPCGYRSRMCATIETKFVASELADVYAQMQS